MIKLENVSKQYGNFYALRNINLEIKEGSFIAIEGSSGSGKSTLLIPGELIKTNSLSYQTYITESGSSISTAITSGIIALLIENENDYHEIMNYIMNYSIEKGFINIEHFVIQYMI